MTEELLNSDRLRLRAVEPEDSRAIWEIEADTTQWLFNGMMAPFSLRNIREYALSYDPDPFRAGQIRLIARREGPEGEWERDVVGIGDLYDISARDRTAWVGVYVRPGFRGAGYATEMLALLERYACLALNLRMLAAKVVEGNTVSRRLFESSGYCYCGVMKGWIEVRSEYLDVYYYQKNLKNA